MYERVPFAESNNPFVAVTESGGAFPAADLLDSFRAGKDMTGSTRYMVDIGAGSRVNISNLGLGYTSSNAIDDHVNTVTVGGILNEVVTSYDMAARYRLTLGAVTVSFLPPATSNAGTIFMVSDSTAIATGHEGQTCAGAAATRL